VVQARHRPESDAYRFLERVPKAKPKGPGGRKPYDRMLLFKIMVLQQLRNLSDEQTEYQVWDRLSFQRFLGLGLEESVPDHTTVHGLSMPLAPWYSRVLSFCASLVWLALKSKTA